MNNESIRPYGLFTTIVLTTIGVGAFSYPRYVCEVAGRDGWISALVAGIFAIIMVSLIYYVQKVNNFNSYVDIIFNSFGKFFGYIVLFLFMFYVVITLSVDMRRFVEVLKIYLLQNTPIEFLILTILALGIYVVGFGVGDLMKFNEVVFFIVFIPMILGFIFLINSVDFTNIMPIGKSSMYDTYISGVYRGFLAFGGYEILFLAAPFIRDREKIKKTTIWSIIFIALFYSFITIYCISIFEVEETKSLLWPTITMITSIDIPGNFVERWEGIVMVLWILFYFTTFIALLYFACYTMRFGFKIRKARVGAIILVPIIYFITTYADNIIHLDYLCKKLLIPLEFINIVIVPILLFIITILKKRKKEGVK